MKKTISLISAVVLTSLLNSAFTQTINWKNLQPSEKHLVNLNIGLDNASVVGIGYGYRLNTRLPLLLNIEYSMPFGKNSYDDFKTKIGGQLNLIKAGSFFTTVKAYSIFRRFENDLTRLVNFGSEFSATAGLYRDKWWSAIEFGFDKAIVTQVKQSDLMKQYNPEVKSGWYIPTGGNFIYGLQSGYSFKRNDVYAKLGKTIFQDFKAKSALPVYFQLGWTTKW